MERKRKKRREAEKRETKEEEREETKEAGRGTQFTAQGRLFNVRKA